MPTFNISFGSAISGLFLRKGTDRIDIPMRLAYAQILNQITTTINWGMIKKYTTINQRTGGVAAAAESRESRIALIFAVNNPPLCFALLITSRISFTPEFIALRV